MTSFVCFGEVLWDVFLDDKKIGGAPLNVATRLASFGNEVSMISAVGNDDLGKGILNFCEENKVSTKHIQVSDNFDTGTVIVTLNEKGNASYEIVHPKAWDKISLLDNQIQLVSNADVFVFGSLVTRDEMSRNTLYQLVDKANYKVFDVNLRPPFYTKDILIDFMHKADFIKLNDEELYFVAELLDSPYHNLEQNIRFIAKETETNHICVTKGSFGAVLLYDNQLYYNSGYLVKVADTVGAGDSFLATLIHHLQQNKNPQEAINFACAVGALVASEKGANPKISTKKIIEFMQL